jgi:hypothetical protein
MHLDSIEESLWFREKSLTDQSIRLSIHHGSNEAANVESCLDKIWVIS